MIALDYELAASWKAHASLQDLACADEGVLRYKVLLGDIIFKTNGFDFSTRWGWVPVIDFVASLRNIVMELTENKDAVFDFTESKATLRFLRTNGSVQISASYAPGQATLPMHEFEVAVTVLSRRLVENIAQEYPSLLQNKHLKRLLKTE